MTYRHAYEEAVCDMCGKMIRRNAHIVEMEGKKSSMIMHAEPCFIDAVDGLIIQTAYHKEEHATKE